MRSSRTRKRHIVLCQLMHRKDVTATICATDAGREGELIFRLVYEMAGCDKPIKRLWISWRKAQSGKGSNLQPGSDYDNLYHSALCRQEADWLVGINNSPLCGCWRQSPEGGQGADTHPCDAGGQGSKDYEFPEGKILHGTYPDGWDRCRHRGALMIKRKQMRLWELAGMGRLLSRRL